MLSMMDIAQSLRAQSLWPSRLAPLVLMSDPRGPDVIEAAKTLPVGSAIIYRHFGAAQAGEIARQLREITRARGLQFLIGKDVDLAKQCGADGVHFPQSDFQAAAAYRALSARKIVTLSAHDPLSLKQASGFDGAFLSPVFPSDSPSAGAPLGAQLFSAWTAKAAVPVFALGGVSLETAPQILESGAAGLAGVRAILA